VRLVIDTNVLIAALRSRRGASFRLLSLIGSGSYEPCVSVPLVLEYEAVAKDQRETFGLSIADIHSIIDYICRVASHHQIHYLWRPVLKDPKDDMVLELAVSASADAIVTFNINDFKGSEKFSVRAIRPHELLREIGELR
jgi:putative PIN family toxin of toxin-antitoxin system